jgi:hypothetical protein
MMPLAEADVLRIGVASAGGGDPVTFSGSPLGIVRNQQLLEKAFAGTGTEIQWFFFKGAGPAVNEALSNQQLDFAYEGDLPASCRVAPTAWTPNCWRHWAYAPICTWPFPRAPTSKAIDDLKAKSRDLSGHQRPSGDRSIFWPSTVLPSAISR